MYIISLILVRDDTQVKALLLHMLISKTKYGPAGLVLNESYWRTARKSLTKLMMLLYSPLGEESLIYDSVKTGASASTLDDLL